MRPLLPLLLGLALACNGGGNVDPDPDTDTDAVDPALQDPDADGLTNAEEAELGTDPDNPDTDSDGLLDGDEVNTYETDPLDDDSDDDGLLDGAEVDTHETDPLDDDSDDDGLLDGAEVDTHETDPLDDDSDDDGLLDGAEVDTHGTDPADDDSDDDTLLDGDEINVHGTNPLLDDSDADGLLDADEVNGPTDALDPDSDDDGLLDGEEVNTHTTDPLDEDSDDDGLTDGDEVNTHGTDPADDDTDDDGLLDGEEIDLHGTDPTLADTDGDRLSDFEELNESNTDPTLLDTDGDGLSDGDEVLDHGSDPLLTDTDKDGLSDGDEINLHGSDPTLPDTDGDSIADGDEVVNYGTNPALADSDADGLDDDEEIFNVGTDPLNADTDGDGLDDGPELTNNADPFDTDTDDDNLSDGDEVNVHGTEPDDRDTDDGGSTDGAEVLSDFTNPLDATDDVCDFVSVDLIDPTLPAGPDFDPQFIGVEVEMLVDPNGANDFFLDFDEDGLPGADESFSSALIFTLYGPEIDELCSVIFDADWTAATFLGSTPGWTPSSGSIFEAWDIDPANGVTDCPSLDAAVYGSTDIREVLDDLSVGVGLGSLGALQTPLQDAVIGAGLDWTNDWAPFVYGSYVTFDGTEALLNGYAFDYDATCDELLLDADGFLIDQTAATAAPLPDGLRSSSPLLVQTFEDVTGITCDEADIDLGTPGWLPTLGVMTNPGMLLQLDLVEAADGDWVDYYFDSDGDGTPEPFSSSVVITILDTTGTNGIYCNVVYDGNDVVEIDPTALTAIDALGGAATVDRAWQITLGDAESDCQEIDAAVYGTNNIVTLFTGTTLQFAIGDVTANLDGLGTTVFTDYPTVEPWVHGEFWGFGTGTVVEVNYGWLFDTDDCNVVDVVEDPVSAPAAQAGRVGNLATTAQVYFFGL